MNPSIRALELAIAHGDTNETIRLIDSQPELLEVHFPENVGLTPLMWACRNRHTAIVEFLLQKGASVNVTNPVDAKGDGGNTALWFTAQGASPGTVPLARLLLDHRAAIDARCERGTTAFFLAVSWLHMELVQFLISRGADPFIENDDGKTPLQVIRKHAERLETQTGWTEDEKRFHLRAPRMIAFLESLKQRLGHQ
jgi:ankyrin repeat protein